MIPLLESFRYVSLPLGLSHTIFQPDIQDLLWWISDLQSIFIPCEPCTSTPPLPRQHSASCGISGSWFFICTQISNFFFFHWDDFYSLLKPWLSYLLCQVLHYLLLKLGAEFSFIMGKCIWTLTLFCYLRSLPAWNATLYITEAQIFNALVKWSHK